MCKQLVVIQSNDPKEFEEAFNAKLRELEECEPEYEFHHGAGYYECYRRFFWLLDKSR